MCWIDNQSKIDLFEILNFWKTLYRFLYIQLLF